MSTGVSSFSVKKRNVLNGYDILAKSFPGMALLVGLSTLSPKGLGISLSDPNITNFAGFLVIVTLLGFLIGEAVHTLAETIEKTIFYPLRSARNLHKQWRKFIINNTSREQKSAEQRRQHIDDCGIIGKCKIITYWKLNLSFKQHRELFIDLVKSNYDHFLGAWKIQEKGVLFNRFSDSVEYKYDINIKDQPTALSFLYPSIMSRLYMSEARLSKRYQTIYSFCRSMWMTFLILTLGYLYVLMYGTPGMISIPFGEQYQPVGISFLYSSPLPLFTAPLFTGLTTLGFLAACGKYKYHYIEYIIADFPFVVEVDKWESAQTTIDDWAGGDTND